VAEYSSSEHIDPDRGRTWWLQVFGDFLSSVYARYSVCEQ